MPWRALAVLLVVCSTTGCWVDACTYETATDPGTCSDQLDGLFASEDLADPCGGDHLHPFQSCDALGYTLQCGDSNYVPGSLSARTCLGTRGP